MDRRRILAIIVLILMLAPLSGVPIIQAGSTTTPSAMDEGGPPPSGDGIRTGDPVNIQPLFMERLDIIGESDDPDDLELQAIVRFTDIIPLDLDSRAHDLDLRVIRHFNVMPAVVISGPATGFLSLSDWTDVDYIENDSRVIHDMDRSLRTVHAPDAWDTLLAGGQDPPFRVTGQGVTVVVVDTGIDAGHPDLDYGSKTIRNVIEVEPGIWIDYENTDVNYGHGTHVAGTVAGNGDASAGARRGVAPGANLMAVTTPIETESGYMVALEWVYENSRPEDNPHNIRVATNSWHTTVGEWDPQSTLVRLIERITFDNNVVTTWSAGNDGRQDPEGTLITTSGQGNAPIAIEVAAFARDGTSAAVFTSRGKVGLLQTYPDVGGPGVKIWSAAARRTLISGSSYSGGNQDPYYLAISGTSMSTPHVAGLVALLWEVAPSLQVSDRHEDYNGSDPEGWANDPRTRIHEVEWILELSARYLEPSEDRGFPVVRTDMGMDGRPMDYIQGYGMIDAERAVLLAWTLQSLRERHPERTFTVEDAYDAYVSLIQKKVIEKGEDPGSCGWTAFSDLHHYASMDTFILGSNTMNGGWEGEFSRYSDPLGRVIAETNLTHYIDVPPGAVRVELDMEFERFDIQDGVVSELTFLVDMNTDGRWDEEAEDGGRPGYKRLVLDTDGKDGQRWAITVEGRGGKLIPDPANLAYKEYRSSFTFGVTIHLGSTMGPIPPYTPHPDTTSLLPDTPLGPAPSDQRLLDGFSGNLIIARQSLASDIPWPPLDLTSSTNDGASMSPGMALMGLLMVILILALLDVRLKRVSGKGIGDRLRTLSLRPQKG